MALILSRDPAVATCVALLADDLGIVSDILLTAEGIECTQQLFDAFVANGGVDACPGTSAAAPTQPFLGGSQPQWYPFPTFPAVGPAGPAGQSISVEGSIAYVGPPLFDGVTSGDIYIDSQGDGWVWDTTTGWFNFGALRGPPGPAAGITIQPITQVDYDALVPPRDPTILYAVTG